MIKDLEEKLIQEAIVQNVSDIHFEPKRDRMIIRFRRDDVLYLKTVLLEKENQDQLIVRIKVRAGMDISEKRIIQTGRFIFRDEKFSYSIRLSVMPTVFGEKIVLRLLNSEDLNKTFDDLGFNEEVAQKLKRIIDYPSGLFLFTGTTGSGKTTTQMTLIKLMKNLGRNILIIEEPVEYFLDEANQIEVSKERGFDYGLILRETLRQDPDLIVIGEIRDAETARIALRAAGTGHLVFATLHTDNAFDAINRLEEMGISRKALLIVTKGIISQKLLRKLCPNCKEKTFDSNYLNQNIFREKGCEICDNTGFAGRFAIGNVNFLSEKEKIYLLNNLTEDLFYLIEKDVQEMKNQVWEKINCGETSIKEFKRKFILEESGH